MKKNWLISLLALGCAATLSFAFAGCGAQGEKGEKGDQGVGIENLSQALEPFFTTRADEERSGMGFTIMESFMDKVEVVSEKGAGTKIYMQKMIKSGF